MSAQFIHLRVHSEYSLVNGLIRVKKLVAQAAENNMPAVAVTDQSFLSSLVKFYNASIGEGVKPILGADMWVENPDDKKKPFRMPFLVMNVTGYKNLTQMMSDTYQKYQHNDKAVVPYELIEKFNEGLILLSGANYGDVGSAIIDEKLDIAKARLQKWKSIFGDRYYLELHRTDRANDEAHVHAAIALASEFDVPVVATNDVMFHQTDNFDAHEARVCINDGVTIVDPTRDRLYSPEQYFKSADEMAALFVDVPSAIENTVEIARRCSSPVKLNFYALPDYPIPDGMTMDEFFRDLSAKGLENRLQYILDKEADDYEERRAEYYVRLKFELDIILQMGFPGYFLIVMDFIRWSKENDIPVGPGRGSGAGSLVAYVLDITDLDPLEYDLLFERFLNPERVSMPDFDIDFCMEGRDRVIAYVADTYGRQAVSQIITFGTMAAKAVVRDVARVQGKAYGLADKLSKLIPFEVGMNLTKAWETTKELVDFVEGDDDATEIWNMATVLEGTIRNVGKHAGGVVIAPNKLTDFSPLYCDEDGSGLVTQFDKNDVESAGLVKFDFLGLRTLTIIDWAVKTINSKQLNGESPIEIAHIPLDCEKSFALLKRAETTAVFQLESRGMKELILRLLPDNLEDMIALVALFRPGPLESGMVDDFVNRKHGRERVAYPHVDYQHDRLKPILEPTYGVIVYQEQVMQIAQALAGFSLGGADMLRRAMGKKKPEEMAKQRTVFAEGAKSEGIDPELATKIFDLVEKFAGYGFNKSHSAAYALVSYQTLWLKTHYPAAFMAAVMSADMQNTEKVVILVEECRNMGLDLLPPDVNHGEFMFTVNDNNQIIYGLGAVKGVGEGPVEAIVEARAEHKHFDDLFDFCEKCANKKINKRVLEALIKGGAMDGIGDSRSKMFFAISDALQAAGQASRNASAGMMDMFGEMEQEEKTDPYKEYSHVLDWSLKERLKGERDTLGLFLTGHPIDEFEEEVNKITTVRLGQLEPRPRMTQIIAGLVLSVRTMITKSGKSLGIITLDDRTGRTEITVFGEQWDEMKPMVIVDEIVVAEAEVAHDEFSDRTRVKTKALYTLQTARLKLIKAIRVGVSDWSQKQIQAAVGQIVNAEAENGAFLQLSLKSELATGVVQLDRAHKIPLDDETLFKIKQLFSENEFIYHD
ncbi:DNA polymerase III subunit alpha [Marinicellulosiphila megalodicopiae]|uniref:DNA polymerase III subunit alpha n=1 Tax=Marinicellulosiphila megalodicopiae TaxID=2724896 RepID=UPI003BB1119D